MKGTDLDEIKTYWGKKYPNIVITLWTNDSNTKYYGKMMAYDTSLDLAADTVGELINQGENFLRKVI